MTNFRSLTSLLLALVLVLACSQTDASADALAPPTPAMPSHRRVNTDISYTAADIRPVSASLGAKVSALRNTTYSAGGPKIKLNTIVAATPADADSIMRALGNMKPEEWFLRRGLLIYEFVGSNDAIPEMRKARDLLVAH